VDLAAALFQRLRPALPCVRFLDDHSFTDALGQHAWRLVGLSPLLRFMRNPPGGRHLCHYDAAFDYGDGRRTLLSVVFYLSDAPGSGATRFVRDGQESLPTAQRKFDDWTRDTLPTEVVASVAPRAGSVLVFDHRLCHDVERWDGPGDRVIIRADVVYEAIG
jgi:ectoine hydroxylase-related dioxygenase (phytanoyl-CoA dioxygenase family)